MTFTMEPTRFTPEQLQDWRDYEAVRKGGAYHMFDPRAQQLAGLSKDRYLFVMNNFADLKAASESQSD